MKKLGLILKLLVVIAVVATGVYFARIREVYSGTMVIDDHRGTPIAGVNVRLYKRTDIERWINNDFVASFLHWKDREEELRLLQEMYGLHENLLGAQKPAINSKLGKYKADKSLGFTSVEFPDKLFRQIRLDLPSDLYDPAKSLFYHRKADEQDLTKQIFFNKLKQEFPDINSHNIQQIQNKCLYGSKIYMKV